MTQIDSLSCSVLKTLEKLDVLFPFTVAASTVNLYGQYSSKFVNDTDFVSNPEIQKYNNFNLKIIEYC